VEHCRELNLEESDLFEDGGHLNEQIEELETRAARYASDAEKLRLLHSTISSAAAHLAGGAGATAG
jgi:hypothetical protein